MEAFARSGNTSRACEIIIQQTHHLLPFPPMTVDNSTTRSWHGEGEENVKTE